MVQEREVEIRPTTNTTLNKWEFKNWLTAPLLCGSLPEGFDISLEVCSKEINAFFACITTKLRGYRARLGLDDDQEKADYWRWNIIKELLRSPKRLSGVKCCFRTDSSGILTSDSHGCDRNPAPKWVWAQTVTSWCRAQTPPGTRHQRFSCSALLCSLGPACKEKGKFCLCVPQFLWGWMRQCHFLPLQKHFEVKGRNCCNNGGAEQW